MVIPIEQEIALNATCDKETSKRQTHRRVDFVKLETLEGLSQHLFVCCENTVCANADKCQMPNAMLHCHLHKCQMHNKRQMHQYQIMHNKCRVRNTNAQTQQMPNAQTHNITLNECQVQSAQCPYKRFAVKYTHPTASHNTSIGWHTKKLLLLLLLWWCSPRPVAWWQRGSLPATGASALQKQKSVRLKTLKPPRHRLSETPK